MLAVILTVSIVHGQGELHIFLRIHPSTEKHLIDIASDADGHALFKRVASSGSSMRLSTDVNFTLSFQRIPIIDDETHLADLGVCSESTIDMIRRMPISDMELMYQMFEGSVDEDHLEWWPSVKLCHEEPSEEHCSLRSVMGTDDLVIHNHTDDYGAQQHVLKGIRFMDTFWTRPIKLELLPNSVEQLVVLSSGMTSIDLVALTGKPALRVLILNGVQSILRGHSIQHIDLRQLKGSLLEEFVVQSNGLQEIELEFLRDTRLRVLNIQNNQLDTINLRGLAGTTLNELDL